VDNTVIIDMEGGTIEGDLQGLEKGMDFIFNDESALRPRCAE